MRSSTALSLFALLLSALAGVPATPGVRPANLTRDLQASKDTTLIESESGNLSDGSGPVFFVGRTGQPADSIRRGLISFNIAGSIPAGSKVTSVDLTLHLTRSAEGDTAATATLYRVLADWGEGSSNTASGRGAAASQGDATWLYAFYPKTRWAHPGGYFAEQESGSARVAGIGAYTWTGSPKMAADVQQWLDSPGTNFGWLILGDESRGGTAKVFASRENPDEKNRPLLKVTFNPPER